MATKSQTRISDASILQMEFDTKRFRESKSEASFFKTQYQLAWQLMRDVLDDVLSNGGTLIVSVDPDGLVTVVQRKGPTK